MTSSYSIRCLVLALAVSAVAGRAFPVSSSEYEVKAAFLYKFGNFIEVPLSGNAPFVVTVLGDDPFGDTLDATVLGKTINGHPIQIRRARRIEEVGQALIVFVCRSESSRLRSIFAELQKQPALTVGDSVGFAAAGGMIGLVLDQNRIRFEINPGAAEQAGVRINAKLLNLAHIVTTARER